MATKLRAPRQKKMRTIDRWYIGETIGKGGYSWVKKGFDKKTGKCVALKFMAKADESWAKEQFKQVVTEMESLKQIRHPNVMKLYAYNLNARYPTTRNEKIDSVLLVLEYVSNGELFDILYYTSALEPILARSYFHQSIFALEACHNAGVAHRDIKPQNLLLDSRFNLKLTDFGLRKVFESDADAIMKTTYVETKGYQAPELLLDKAYDLACDIFSMGVVLFVLITGYPPFEQAHYSDRWFRALAKADFSKFWKYHAGCSISSDEKCKDLVQKMLAYDPKQRITIAQIKKHPWFNATFLQGKELVRALRHRHSEMEAKRRRDARKINNLPISVTPCRCSGGHTNIPIYPYDIEAILSNCYCHFKEARDFFDLLRALIDNTYSGVTDLDHESDTNSVLCTVTKREKSKGDKSAKAIKCSYKFKISLYKSKRYARDANIARRKANNEEMKAEENEYYSHRLTTNQETVYVVTIKRISGDDFKFRRLQRELLKDGASLFNGLPAWAEQIDKSNDDELDNVFKYWDECENDNKQDADEYDEIEWDEKQE